MIIEIFNETHYAAAAELTRRNMAEHFPHLAYDEAKMKFELDNALAGARGITGFVAVHHGEVVGYLMAIIQEHAFATGKVGTLRVLYVRPESRGSSAAFRLMNVFKDFTRALGCVETHVGVTSGYRTDQARRFFEKLGYTYAGPLLMMKGN